MKKMWLIARYEYLRRASQKGFLFMLASLPLIIALMVGLGMLIESTYRNDTPLGYVDHAGVLADPLPPPQTAASLDQPSVPEPVPLIPFASEEQARQALQAGEIQAYYVIAADYRESRRVELFYLKAPAANATSQFRRFMQINLLRDGSPAGTSPEAVRRAVAGSRVTVYWPDDMPGGGREFSGRTFVSNIIPFVLGFAFIMLLFMNSGHLVGLVGDEKENRTIEVLVTSVSPRQLIAGKVAGIMGLVLTEIVSWTVLLALVVWIGSQAWGWDLLGSIHLDWRPLLAMAATGVPAYVMIAALMAALGATVVEVHDAQQAAGLFALPAMIPYWLAWFLLEHGLKIGTLNKLLDQI